MLDEQASTVSSGATRAVRLDRRAAVRYPCHLAGTCQPLHASSDACWQATVINLSKGGMGLLTDRPFEPRAVLVIELPTRDGSGVRTLTVRVVHVHPEPPGQWFVGCAFVGMLRKSVLEELL